MPTVHSKEGMFGQWMANERAKIDMAKYGMSDVSGLYADRIGSAKGYEDAARAGQLNALAMYQAGALGQGPSVARNMLQQQTATNNRAGMQAAAQGRGGNLAGMEQQVMAQTAGANAQAAGQAATIGAQEQQAARAGYADVANSMGQMGLGYQQLGQQAQIAGNQQIMDWQFGDRSLDMQRDQNKFARNMGIVNGVIGGVSAIGDVVGGIGGASDERLKTNVAVNNPFAGGVDDEGRTNPYAPMDDVDFASQMDIAKAQPRNQMIGKLNSPAQFRYAPVDDAAFQEAVSGAAAGTKLGEISSKMGMTTDGMVAAPVAPQRGEEKNGFEKWGNMIGKWSGVADAAGSMGKAAGGFSGLGAGFSDERVKQPSAGASATQAIEAAPSVSFEYQPGAGPPGRRAGVMAQDLERTPAGAAIVHDTPQGKMVDTFGASTLALAGQNEARQREKVLEGRLAQLESKLASPKGQAVSAPMTSIAQAESGGSPVANINPGMLDTLDAARASRTLPTGEELPSPQELERRKQELTRNYSPTAGKRAPSARIRSQAYQREEDEKMGTMSPQQRQLVDAFWDEMDKWSYIDEGTGERRVGAKRLDLGGESRQDRRFLDAVDAEESAYLNARRDANTRPLPARRGGVNI